MPVQADKKQRKPVIRVLAVAEHSDLAETHMFIGLSQSGVHLEVMCPDNVPNRQRLVDAGIVVHSLQLDGRFDRVGTAEIRQRVIDGEFDIVHAFNNPTVSNSLRAIKGLDVRFIAYRGIEANVSVISPSSWTTYLHHRVDKIICVADAIRRFLVKLRFLWWSFPPDKAITIYKGHDLGWYRSPAVPRDQLGLPESAFVVGCTVNERPRKGLTYLIDAAALLPKDADIHFLLIGRINGKPTLDRIAASPLRENIHLTGYRNDAPQALASCNACILPALRREGLPKGIIEGMAYAVTPIVTDSGGSPELVEVGKSGIVIPPGSAQAIADAILQLYNDQQACREMGLAAQQRIQRDFHVSKTVEQTLAVYEELVASRHAG